MAEIRDRIVGSGWKVRRNGALGEEQMVNNFVERRTLRRVGGEDLLDKFLDVCGDGTIVWELVFVVSNTPGSTVRPENHGLEELLYL